MRILISTCNKYDHLVLGCVLQLHKYWPGHKITVVGFRDIPALPDNVKVDVMAPVETEPWSTHLRAYVERLPESHFVFLFDDYWLTRPVNEGRVAVIRRLVTSGGVDKGDLSANTNYFEHKPYAPVPGLVAAAQVAHYRSSTQPAIWTKAYMLKLLRPGWNPWQFELNAPAGRDGAVIVGPTTPIYHYANVFYKGSPDMAMLTRLSDYDLNKLSEAGAMSGLPPPQEVARWRANK